MGDDDEGEALVRQGRGVAKGFAVDREGLGVAAGEGAFVLGAGFRAGGDEGGIPEFDFEGTVVEGAWLVSLFRFRTSGWAG